MRSVLSLLMASLLLCACASVPKVNTDHNPDYNFAAARKFAIVPPQSVGAGAAGNSILNKRVEGAVREALLARGYQIVKPAQADMWVSYFVTTRNKTDINTYNQGYGYRRCWSVRCSTMITSVDVTQYTEGTLFVDFIDPAKRELQWRGMASKRLNQNSSPEKRKALIREYVTAIIAAFPPSAN